MSPFFVYAVSQNGSTHYRTVLIFANHLVADEWWREASKDPAFGSIQRCTPQFYRYNSSKLTTVHFLPSDPDVADRFIGRMSMERDNHHYHGLTASILPSIEITDNVSGNWFHIRSKVDPRLYWSYEENTDRIILSDNHNARTAFRITAIEEPEGTIMIGKDKISIAAPGVNIGVHATQGGYLPEDSQARYVGGGGVMGAFTFQDLVQGRFLFDRRGYNYLTYDPSNRAQQEIWELVGSYSIPI